MWTDCKQMECCYNVLVSEMVQCIWQKKRKRIVGSRNKLINSCFCIWCKILYPWIDHSSATYSWVSISSLRQGYWGVECVHKTRNQNPATSHYHFASIDFCNHTQTSTLVYITFLILLTLYSYPISTYIYTFCLAFQFCSLKVTLVNCRVLAYGGPYGCSYNTTTTLTCTPRHPTMQYPATGHSVESYNATQKQSIVEASSYCPSI